MLPDAMDERMDDLANYGVSITRDGERIAPEDFYASTLLPCPFCGCEMRLETSEQRDPVMGPRIFWTPVAVKHHMGFGGYCHGESARGSASVEAALARWNAREYITMKLGKVGD